MLRAIAIKHYGSLAAVARALGITRSAVTQWGRIVPEGMAYKLESITKGELQVDPHRYVRTASKEARAG